MSNTSWKKGFEPGGVVPWLSLPDSHAAEQRRRFRLRVHRYAARHGGLPGGDSDAPGNNADAKGHPYLSLPERARHYWPHA